MIHHYYKILNYSRRLYFTVMYSVAIFKWIPSEENRIFDTYMLGSNDNLKSRPETVVAGTPDAGQNPLPTNEI